MIGHVNRPTESQLDSTVFSFPWAFQLTVKDVLNIEYI